MKVKLFDSVSLDDLQNQINLFLQEYKPQDIQNISISTSQGFILAAVLYTDHHKLLEQEVGVYISDREK